MYHTEPPTDKTIREWYMNSSRVAACALRNEQAVRAYGSSVILGFRREVDENCALLSSYAVISGNFLTDVLDS